MYMYILRVILGHVSSPRLLNFPFTFKHDRCFVIASEIFDRATPRWPSTTIFIYPRKLSKPSISIDPRYVYVYIYINYPFHFEEIKDISIEKALDGRTNAKHGGRSKNWDRRGRCHILPSFTNFTRVVRVHYEIPAGYYAPRLRSQPLDAIPGV